jgi:hypothetical protein
MLLLNDRRVNAAAQGVFDLLALISFAPINTPQHAALRAAKMNGFLEIVTLLQQVSTPG